MADANVLIAAFLKDSTVRRIVTLSGIQLLVPEFISEELHRHLPQLRARVGLGKKDAEALVENLFKYLVIVPSEEFSGSLREAERIMTGIDQRDAVYLALALSLPCEGIWSDDAHLKRQRRVRCFATRELVAELRASGFSV